MLNAYMSVWLMKYSRFFVYGSLLMATRAGTEKWDDAI